MNVSSTHSIFPRELLKEGTVLPINLYVFLPHNETLILYRKLGEKIGPDNIASLKKIPHDQLLYLTSETEKLFQLGSDMLANSIEAGEIASDAVKSTSAGMLQTMQEGSNLGDCMNRAADMVQSLVKDFKKTPAVVAYDNVLKLIVDGSIDPLTIHQQQVSAIAVLMALTTGEFSIDDISDLAAAGLIHDLGLMQIHPSLSQSHFQGMRELSPEEKAIYMLHIQHTLDLIKKQRIHITPGIERIIEHHHERWDGLGFKHIAGNKIYRPARILHIADDLVCIIQGSNHALGFKSGLDALQKISGHYDPTLMKTLATELDPK